MDSRQVPRDDAWYGGSPTMTDPAADFAKRAQDAMLQLIHLYYHPGRSLDTYLGRTDLHSKQVPVRRGEYSVLIDAGIAPLIEVVWGKGWHTAGSCECYVDERAYILFTTVFGADRFCAALASSGVPFDREETKTNFPINMAGVEVGRLVFESFTVRIAPGDIEKAALAVRTAP
jgi:hypothetical protein